MSYIGKSLESIYEEQMDEYDHFKNYMPLALLTVHPCRIQDAATKDVIAEDKYVRTAVYNARHVWNYKVVAEVHVNDVLVLDVACV